jgi:hypothetical protein
MSFLTRTWNNTPISRRSTDEYVNATAMCKANGKQWNDYWRLDRATEYLEALSSETGISVSNLCLVTKGGAYQGTWVHPQVAIDLARWISAPFAVWMDGWLLAKVEEQGEPQANPAPRLAGEELINLAERSMALMERLGGLDERDELLFRDIVRTNLLTASSGSQLALPQDPELTLSDAWLKLYGSPLPRTEYHRVGSQVSRLYREEHGNPPPKREQYVDGAIRKVNSYRTSWLISALQRIKQYR